MKSIDKLYKKKIYVCLIDLILIALSVFGIIFGATILTKVVMFISIAFLVVCLILFPFLAISKSETLQQKRMHDLIVVDGITLVPELVAIFGLGNTFARQTINELISNGYLDYKYKNSNILVENKHYTIK